MKKYVVIAIDENPTYCFDAGMCRDMWHKHGFNVLTIVVTKNNPEFLQHCYKSFNEPGDRTEFINPDSYPFARTGSLAQISRIFAYLYFNEPVYLLTADVDMMPLKLGYWDRQPSNVNVHGFDITGRKEIPIPYVGMSIENWGNIMGKFETFNEGLSDCLLKYKEKLPSSEFYDYWGIDQQYLTIKFKNYGMNKVTLIDRGSDRYTGLPKGRIDRYCWEKKTEDPIDSHNLHPCHNDENWNRTKKRLSSYGWEKYQDYRDTFIKLLNT